MSLKIKLHEASARPFQLDGDLVQNLEHKFSLIGSHGIQTKRDGKATVFVIDNAVAVKVSLYTQGGKDYCSVYIYDGPTTRSPVAKFMSFMVHDDYPMDNESIADEVSFWARKYIRALLKGEELPNY